MVSNLSFLNCDVFIKFNHHEYTENDYLKKKKPTLVGLRMDVLKLQIVSLLKEAILLFGCQDLCVAQMDGGATRLAFPELGFFSQTENLSQTLSWKLCCKVLLSEAGAKM